MKHYKVKKLINIILVFSVVLGLFGNGILATTYAEEKNEQTISTGQNPSPFESVPLIAEQFNITEDFIEGYLHQDYTLNEIH
ncbi:hypothetical protein P9222_14690 [Paenibacillus amylolyticus]|nr:hypothetical protein [Paenibacillus amylolyticus]WFR65137.1 hypothetical protein P9222_14690 [Paenibacillus amylolyticus]